MPSPSVDMPGGGPTAVTVTPPAAEPLVTLPESESDTEDGFDTIGANGRMNVNVKTLGAPKSIAVEVKIDRRIGIEHPV